MKMKLIVTTASHGIDAGEYTGAQLRTLIHDRRYSVTSLVARGHARWVHEDSREQKDASSETAKAIQTAEKPKD